MQEQLQQTLTAPLFCPIQNAVRVQEQLQQLLTAPFLPYPECRTRTGAAAAAAPHSPSFCPIQNAVRVQEQQLQQPLTGLLFALYRMPYRTRTGAAAAAPHSTLSAPLGMLYVYCTVRGSIIITVQCTATCSLAVLVQYKTFTFTSIFLHRSPTILFSTVRYGEQPKLSGLFLGLYPG
jgi:hypothetical protein